MELITQIKIYRKWNFFIFFLLGFFCIVLLKVLGVNQIVVTIIPVGLIVFYFFSLPRANKSLENNNQNGDSLYYLGFLFTLVSLVCSLVQFTLQNNSIDSIISNLGIALLTTITGMVGRIVYLQQSELDFTEEDIRIQLNHTTQEIARELSDVLSDISLIRESTKTALEDIERDFTERLNKEIEDSKAIYDAHREVLGEFSKYYKKELTTLIDDIKYFCDVTKQETQDALIENLNAYSDGTKSLLLTASSTIKEIVEKFEQYEKNQTEQINLLENALALTLEALKNFNFGLDAIKAEPEIILQNINSSLKTFENALTTTNKKLKENLDSQSKIEIGFKTIIRSTNDLVAEYQSYGNTIKGVNSNIEKIDPNKVIEFIEKYQKSLSKLQEFSDGWSNILKANLEKSENYNKAIEDEMLKSKDYVSQVHQSLLTMTELIVTNIQTQEVQS